MSWKNTIENIVIIAVMFVGLGVYTHLVLKPILIESIRTETTKIETKVTNKIDNKFKKIEELTAQLPLTIPVTSTQSQTDNTNSECAVSVDDFNKLSDGEKKRLKRWLEK